MPHVKEDAADSIIFLMGGTHVGLRRVGVGRRIPTPSDSGRAEVQDLAEQEKQVSVVTFSEGRMGEVLRSSLRVPHRTRRTEVKSSTGRCSGWKL